MHYMLKMHSRGLYLSPDNKYTDFGLSDEKGLDNARAEFARTYFLNTSLAWSYNYVYNDTWIYNLRGKYCRNEALERLLYHSN